MFSPRNLLILTLLVAFPQLASAQLHFTQTTVDLGPLRGGPAYQHRFEFVNDSRAPMELLGIRLGCGCLRPVYEKRVYQPGEKSAIVMHIRTLGQPSGPRTWHAYVQCRQGDKQQETVLALAATLRQEVTIEPSILAMSVETTLRQEMTITDARMPSLQVTTVRASSPAIRVVSQSVVNGVTRVVLEVSRTGLTEARQEEMLDIDTDDANYRHLQVPITLMKASQAPLQAIPERVEFRAGAAGSRLVRLRGVNDLKVSIERAVADHPALKCTWAAGPGNDATLRISLDPQQALSSSPATASVRVQLSGASAVTVTIPVELRKE